MAIETLLKWPEEGVSRVPYQVYADKELYDLEQEKIFRGSTWNFVALAEEIPNPGDYKTTYVGDTPVVVNRGADGEINVFVNRCSHKGARVCMDTCGNAKTFTCVYHSWSFNPKGDLIGVPFRNGIDGKGGMPEDFDMKKHGLRKLKVSMYRSLIFATFDENMQPLEDYLGEKMRENIDQVFKKPIRIFGYNRQVMKNNWKLYFENVKDSYHASLLHLFFSTFGINRLSQKGGIHLDEIGMHHISYTYGSKEEDESSYKKAQLRSYQSGKFQLEDPSLLHGRTEHEDGITLAIQSIFPNLVVQRIHNALALRQLIPMGVDRCELFWIHFGYADDDEEMRMIRMKQGNLVGPAGFVSLEDGGIGEQVQKGIVGSEEANAVLEMGGRDVQSQEYRVTETAIRGFWKRYRELMGV